MAAVFRSLIAVFLVAFFSAPASASFPSSSVREYAVQGGTAWFVGVQAACDDSAYTRGGGGALTPYPIGGPVYASCRVPPSFVSLVPLSSRVVDACPANSTLSGGTCSCNSGFEEFEGTCRVQLDPADQYCQDSAGSGVQTSFTTTAPALGAKSVCATGGFYHCSANVDVEFCGSHDGTTYLCHAKGTSTSSKCTPSAAPETPAAPEEPPTGWPDAPPLGMCPGTINGVAVNVPCTSSSTGGTSSSETDDGAGTVTGKTENKVTTCSATGTCTTTTTTTTTVNGGTPKVSTGTSTQPQSEFCASNASHAACKATAFNGTCAAAFTCSGDPIFCATAKAANEHLCKVKEIFEMDPVTLAMSQAILAGTHVEHPKDDPRVEHLGEFDQSNPFSETCPSDVSLNLSVVTLSIPLSRFCDQLRMMGNLLVVFTLLSATMFVLRGVH